MEQFNAVKEVFASLIKWFLLFAVVNNLIWMSVFGYYIHRTFETEPVSISQTQDGYDNHQEINR